MLACSPGFCHWGSLISKLVDLCCCIVYTSCILAIVYKMQFSQDNLYNLEKDLSSVFGSVFGSDEGDLRKAAIMKKNKDVLANLVLSVAGVLERSRTVLRSAVVNIEELKTNQIQNQKKLIELQDELIQSKGDQVKAVQRLAEMTEGKV